MHDEKRVDKKGYGTYDKVLKNIKQLQDYARQGDIPPVGALCIINPYASGKTAYKHLVHVLDFNNISFLLPFMNWNNYDEGKVQAIKNLF